MDSDGGDSEDENVVDYSHSFASLEIIIID